MYDTAEAEKHDQSQLDITVFRNWLLKKARLSSYAHCLSTFGAISPLRDERILSASEGCHDDCHVSPKTPKTGLRGSEKKENKLCQNPGVPQEIVGRGKDAPRGQPTPAALRARQPRGAGRERSRSPLSPLSPRGAAGPGPRGGMRRPPPRAGGGAAFPAHWLGAAHRLPRPRSPGPAPRARPGRQDGAQGRAAPRAGGARGGARPEGDPLSAARPRGVPRCPRVPPPGRSLAGAARPPRCCQGRDKRHTLTRDGRRAS